MAIREIWNEIETTLRRVAPKFSLPRGASTEGIAASEQALGIQLPADYRESVAIHDGTGSYLLYDSELRPLRSVVETQRRYLDLVRDPPPIPASESMRISGPVRAQHWSPKWIPIARTTSANTILLDLDPADGGSIGQVVHISRELSEVEVLSSSFGAWIADFCEELVAGRFEIRVFNGDVMELERRV
ncbi:MAG: SMI1/KNR4 family protein [Kofleriaceae bacterium]